MIPIHELINRIRWDEDFADADIIIGYYDRQEKEIIRRSLTECFFEDGDRYFFHFIDDDGEQHSVPLHRIKEVMRDGVRIWHREH